MLQQLRGSKQRYYRNINILSLCMPVLHSGNFQSEHVAAGKSVQITILSVIHTLSFYTPVLHSGNFQSEHVTAVELFQTTILSEH